MAPRPKLDITPNDYQVHVLDLARKRRNVRTKACAGSGKTSLMRMITELEALEHVRGLYAVYNRSARAHAETVISAGWSPCTTHSLGRQICVANGDEAFDVDPDKVRKIIKEQLYGDDWDRRKWQIGPACTTVSLIKNTLTDATSEGVDYILRRYGIPLLVPEQQNEFTKLVLYALRMSDKVVKADFDDLLYWPVTREYRFPAVYDVVLGDEVQDWNRAQVEMMLRAVAPGGNMMVVGDHHQAIYQWRGADTMSMELLADRLQAVDAPLSMSFRCCEAIARWVNERFDGEIEFEAAPWNPVGQVLYCHPRTMLENIREGDFLMGRTNAELVDYLWTLIMRGVKAAIKGKEIRAELITFVEYLSTGVDSLGAFLMKMNDHVDNVEAKLMLAGKQRAAERLVDKANTVVAIATWDRVNTIGQLVEAISDIFSDERQEVTLMTVHKGKGLEVEARDDCVWVLDENMPHAYASTPEEVEEEKHVEYVAGTRGKDNLVFVNEKYDDSFDRFDAQAESC
jgi:superfamily I DNA/RNA helicase